MPVSKYQPLAVHDGRANPTMPEPAMTQYLLFFMAFAASAAAPGPEIAGVLSRSLSGGIASSVPLAVGIIAGKLLMLTAAIAGLTALLTVLGPMLAALKLVGAAYLIWLGVKKWRKAGLVLAASEQASKLGFGIEVSLGLGMTLSNPIAIIFYIALLPGVIDVSGVTPANYAILCAIIVGVMVAVVLGYGLLAELARRSFSSPKAKTRIDRFSGAMMVGAGVLIATR